MRKQVIVRLQRIWNTFEVHTRTLRRIFSLYKNLDSLEPGSSLNLRGTALGDAGVRALATAMYGCRDAQGELWAMQLTLSAQARAGSAAGSDGMLARLLAGSAISYEAKELLHDAVCSDGAPEPRGREPSPWGSGRILWT